MLNDFFPKIKARIKMAYQRGLTNKIAAIYLIFGLIIMIFCFYWQYASKLNSHSNKPQLTSLPNTFTSTPKGLKEIPFYDCFDTVVTIASYAYTPEEFQVIANDIHSKLYYYHKLLDNYHAYTDLNNLYTLNSKASQQKIKVDPELLAIILQAKEIDAQTYHLTNAGLGAVLKLWENSRLEFKSQPDWQKESSSQCPLPTSKLLQKASLHSNLDMVEIDVLNSTVYYKDKFLQIDLGALAKGFVADKIIDYAHCQNFHHLLINLGGNIVAIDGKNSAEDSFKVGIKRPTFAALDNEFKFKGFIFKDKASINTTINDNVSLPASGNNNQAPGLPIKSPSPFICTLNLKNKIMATSGNYERYFICNGNIYHHIINPRTLAPAANYQSVSVIAYNGLEADALSTALFCSDQKELKSILKNYNDVEVLLVTNSNEIYMTAGFLPYIAKAYWQN